MTQLDSNPVHTETQAVTLTVTGSYKKSEQVVINSPHMAGDVEAEEVEDAGDHSKDNGMVVMLNKAMEVHHVVDPLEEAHHHEEECSAGEQGQEEPQEVDMLVAHHLQEEAGVDQGVCLEGVPHLEEE